MRAKCPCCGHELPATAAPVAVVGALRVGLYGRRLLDVLLEDFGSFVSRLAIEAVRFGGWRLAWLASA